MPLLTAKSADVLLGTAVIALTVSAWSQQANPAQRTAEKSERPGSSRAPSRRAPSLLTETAPATGYGERSGRGPTGGLGRLLAECTAGGGALMANPGAAGGGQTECGWENRNVPPSPPSAPHGIKRESSLTDA
ncbi:hypothetical protein AOLI_G00002390 [Acnodon oligacanthus]